MKNIGSIWASLGIDISEFEKNLKIAQNGLNVFSKKTKAIGKTLSLYISTPLTAAGGFAYKMSADMTESLNKVEESFKDAAGTVKEWAETSIEQMGMAKMTAYDIASMFGDMATGMGMSTQEAAKMSMSLTQLAADLASFKNISLSEAQTALSGIFTGETESLKRLGVVMTETNLKAWALSKGLNANFKEMTQLEKVNLRYQYVMEMTKNAHGDFARTSDSAANTMRRFRETLKELASSFGNVFAGALTNVIEKVINIMKSFAALDDSTKKVIITIAGIAAAVGPALVVIGHLTTAISALLSPLGLVIAAVTTLTAGIGLLVLRKSSLIDKTSLLKKAEQDIAVEYAREKTNVQQLMDTVRDANKSYNERIKALNQLKAISPEHFGNLTLETSLTEQATKNLEAYNTQLKNQLILKKLQQEKDEALNKLAEDEITNNSKKLNFLQSLIKSVIASVGDLGAAEAYAIKQSEKNQQKFRSNIEQQIKNIDELIKKYSDLTDVQAETPDIEFTPKLSAGSISAVLKQQYETAFDEVESTINNRMKDINDFIEQIYYDTEIELPDISDESLQGFETMKTTLDILREKMQVFGEQIANSLMLGSNSFEEFGKVAIRTIQQIITQMIAQALAQSIINALKAAGSMPGPLALFAIPAFIGLALGFVNTAINSAIGLAEGGIIPPGYPNDTFPARLSSGEAVIPLDKLNNYLTPAAGKVEFRIEGTTLVGILNKMQNKLRYS